MYTYFLFLSYSFGGKKSEEAEKAEFVVYVLDMNNKTSFLNKIKVFYFGGTSFFIACFFFFFQIHA